MTAPTVTVDVPFTFHQDHVSRDLPGGTVVKRLARTVRVELDRETYDELLSDADHYAGDAMSEWVAEDFANAMGVVRSARATVKALRAVERPAAVTQ